MESHLRVKPIFITAHSRADQTTRLSPTFSRYFKVSDKTEVKFRSPFGGLVMMISPSGSNSIKFSLENVVETPRFDLTDPNSLTQWPQR